MLQINDYEQVSVKTAIIYKMQLDIFTVLFNIVETACITFLFLFVYVVFMLFCFEPLIDYIDQKIREMKNAR